MARSRRAAVRLLVVIALVAGLLPATTPPATQAADGLGGQLFATGGEVEVQVLPASAGFTSELWLFEPAPARRIATNRDVGLVVNLGTFPAGVELVFGIRVLNTGNEFRMGPGTRNPDGIPHAVVTFLDPTRARVGFEDLYGGGDRDYDDNVFEFRGGIAPEVPKPPVADAGPDQTVGEGAIVTLDGQGSSDSDSTNLTYAWSLVERSGPPITLSSSTGPTPVFGTFDDGLYRFRLTVSDGTASDTDDVLVRVTNALPMLAVQADPAYAGGVALVTTSFTDAGVLDTHAGTIDWGDGSAPESVPVSAQGSGWGSLVASHVYPNPGAYTVRVTVTDDDGGAATTSVAGLAVIVPVALWANSSSTDAAMEATSGAVTVEGRTHTNDDLRLRGGPKTFRGPTEYVRTLDVGGTGATFTPPAVRTAPADFPIRFAIADYRPGGRAAAGAGPAYRDMSSACGADGFWRVAGSTLASGIYYATCGIKINGNPIGGTITLAAEGEIHVSGTGAFFDPFVDGLLFLSASSSASAIRVDASNSTFFGYSFAERGRIVLTGASDRFYCGILGDRIDIASRDLLIRGSGCTNPARTGAPPTLVPRLSVGLAVDRTDALPNEGLTHTATVSNDGATLVVPGVIGLENLGTEAVTVAGHALRFEYQATADGTWSPLPGAVTVRLWPNPVAGVTYPSGGEPIDGTRIAAGALASWGYAAVYILDAAQVTLLLDPTRVAAIRTVSTFELTPPDVPVRRLFRFGDDVAPQLRSAGADATDVTVTVVPPAGDARTFGAPTTPGLATLAPGERVEVALDSTVPGPAARSTDERDAAYLARLAAFDRTPLTGVAFARGGASIGPVLGPSALASTIRHLPIVGLAKRGPAEIVRGSTAAYTLELANTGSAGASGLVVTDALAGVGNLTVTGAPATLDPGASATATSSYLVPASSPLTTLDDLGSVGWTDAAGNAYGPVSDGLSTRVLAPRRLAVTKSALPVEGSGGTALDYEIAITNLGDEPISGVTLADTPDPLTAIVAGSVTTTQGAVTGGNGAGDTAVEVTIGTLAARTTVVVAFRVTVGAIPEGVTAITNQATVTSAELGPIVSDDPLAPGATDPTVTPVGPTSGGGGGGTTGGPTVGPLSPADGTVVTAPVLLATALTPPAGEAVASWRIGATRVDAPGETTLASGPGGVADEVVAVSAPFDPTVLPNGIYRISVRTTASGGGTSVATTSLIVDGNLKLGRYQVTYQDLSVPVGGIPLQVLRTYDSFDKSVGDFGVGWNLELANFRVLTNGPLGRGGWVQETTNCGLIFCETTYRTTRPHVVTVVWPDGRQEIFDLAPANGSTFFAPATAAAFRARPGTTSTLAADGDASLSFFGDGNLYGGGFGSGGLYDPTRFRLTDRFGTQYVLEVGRGLVSARDRNGNTVTVSDAGITSSAGPSIRFTRDPQGRITEITDPANETVRYTYDAAGDLITVSDANDQRTSYEYDEGHNLTRITDPLGRPFRQLEYGTDGRLVAVVDALGNRTEIDVDPALRREVVTDAEGRLTTISSFDLRGNLVAVDKVFDGTSQRWALGYDDRDNLLKRTDPLGNTWAFTYDAAGNLLSSTDPESRAVTWTYDAFGQVVSSTDRAGAVTRFTYDAAGNLATVIDPLGAIMAFEYDGAGNRTLQVDQLGNETRWSYDPQGRAISTTDGLGRTTAFAYDEAGRLTRRTDALGTEISVRYNGVGQVTTVIDGNGNATTYTYDAAGEVVQITDAAGGSIGFGYDGAGRLASMTDPIGVTRSYAYDANGRLLTETLGGATTSYAYDGAGRLASRTDARGSQISFTYDAGDRVVEMASGDGTVRYAYDALGRRIGMTDTTGVTSWSYDPVGRIAEVAAPGGTISYAYDAVGRRTSMVLPPGRIDYRYDAAGRLLEFEDWLGGVSQYAYDDASQLISVRRPNGVASSYGYDAVGNLVEVIHATAGEELVRFAYTYDAAGNRTSLTTSAGAEAYTLDRLDRLTRVAYPDGSSVSYTYDTAGNRTSATAGPRTVTYGYDAAGRLAEVNQDGASTPIAHDAAGNLTDDGARSFSWDAFGRLEGTVSAASSTTYAYDGDGLRVGRTTDGVASAYLWDRTLDVPEVVGDGSSWFLQAPGSTVSFGASGTTYLLEDAVGSTRLVTDGAGAAIGRTAYEPFGAVRSQSGDVPFLGFAGELTDPTRLIYLRARYYEPSLGRFLSVDPVQPNAPGTQGWNRYIYALDNPTTLVDPRGLSPFAEFSVRSALIGAALGVGTRLPVAPPAVEWNTALTSDNP